MALACLLAGLFSAVPGPALGAAGLAAPVRVLDTRLSGGPLGPGATLNVTVPGGGPAVLNVTATNATAPSYLTLWPAGQPRPTASSLNFGAGQTVANLVTVPLGANGQVSVFNLSGSVDVIFDSEGAMPAGFTPVGPVRVLDTRLSGGAPGPGATYRLSLTGAGQVPAAASAAVLNVTAVTPSRDGFLTVYPDGIPRPTASNLNFIAGQTVANRVLVGLGSGAVDIYNLAGSTDLVVDITGWFGTSGGAFTGLAGPTRILDSRSGLGVPQQPLGPQGSFSLQVAGVQGIPASGVAAVVANLTVTDATSPSYLTTWPDGSARPTVSDLNFAAGQTVANMVVVPLGSSGKIDLYNNGGCSNAILDVVGWFAGTPIAGTAAAPAVVACPPPPPPPPANAPGWLVLLNDYRAVAGLPPVSEDPALSAADCAHAQYIVETGQRGHTEDPANPWYTAAGAAAGASSNVAWNFDPSQTDDYFIDWWMRAPFHALGIVRPGLNTVGFCARHDAARSPASAAALNVLSGLGSATITAPIYFPGNGTTINQSTYPGGEEPDPMTSCPPGWGAGSGLPVFVQLPSAVTAVQGHAFLDGASNLPSCEESGADYVNPDSGAQQLGRALLGNVVVVIPQAPLVLGHTYQVVIDVNGQHQVWGFTAG